MDFSSVTSTSSVTPSSVMRRPVPTSPESSASAARPGGDSGSGGGTTVYHAAIAATSLHVPLADVSASSNPPLALGLHKSGSRAPKAELHVSIEEPSMKPEIEGRNINWAASPSSASTATSAPFQPDSHEDSPNQSSSAEPQDEHDRAVAAFLRENGFKALTGRRRSSLVGFNCPLHSAASQGLVRMTDLLIKAGADPSQKNSWGQTPMDVARRCNKRGSHDGVLRVLERGVSASVS